MKLYQSEGGQPLNRVIAICRILSILCTIAFVVIALWSIFALCLIIYSLATAHLSNQTVALAYAVPILYALYSINACLLPFVLGRMLGSISAGRTPFTPKNASRLFLIASVLLLYAILELLLASVDTQFVLSLESSSVEVGNLVSSFSSSTGTTLNLFPLLMAAMFFALSYVFKYGVLLQQESDETL